MQPYILLSLVIQHHKTSPVSEDRAVAEANQYD